MATKKYINPFAVFINTEVKTATIKALDNAEVEYRELTLRENDAFNSRMIEDFDPRSGEDPTINIAEATRIKYEKVALMLITPAMTADELMDLPFTAGDAIEEILNLQKDDEEEMVDNEGN